MRELTAFRPTAIAWRPLMLSHRRAWLIAPLVLFVACASVRVDHSRTVASAGSAWARAMDAVLVLAEESAVDADSARLLSQSQGLTRDARRQLLEKHAGVAGLVTEIERLRRHARLLGRYFDALHGLTETDADIRARDAVVKAAAGASELGREISGSALLTASDRELAGKGAGFAVRAVRERALAAELEARGAAIEQELGLEQALLEAIRRQIRADAVSLRELGTERDVVRPLLEDSIADSRGWIALRRAAMLPAPALEAISAAGDSASRLRSAWAALAGGRFDEAAWSAVLADAETLVALARSVREARR